MGLCNHQPKSCPRLRGKWHEVPKGVRLGRWVSRERKPEGLHRGCSFFRQPLSRLAATAPRPGSLLVQCKHIVQCRTPREAIVSMGLRGVQGGPKGRNRNLPRPPCKKIIKKLIFFLFGLLPQSRLRLDSSPARGGAFWRSANSYVKPALKGEVDMSVSEWTEGLHRGFACLRQPLSQSALRRIASSP